MNCLCRVPSYTSVVLRRSSVVLSRPRIPSLPAFYPPLDWVHFPTFSDPAPWKSLVRFYSQSSKKGRPKAAIAKSKLKTAEEVPTAVDREKGVFYVVRKGDIVGVYRSFSDCQAQFGSSIHDPPVSILKGHDLPTESKDYILSRGLKNAMYTMDAADLKDDLFGMLTPCPVVEPASYRVDSSQEDDEGSVEVSSIALSCKMEFDGASKGNPGRAGAGAVLRADDGTLVCKVWEGVGEATCNFAEYRGIILGMKFALQKGYKRIRIQGDSKLVCMQVQGLWKVRHKELAKLFKVVKTLKQNFLSFEISHVLRAENKEADSLANKGVILADGEVEEECIQLS
ncbi:hypothetical protein MLD38_008528 [Melastoma candidum]|uniref:Uncharacterized protein n=1 Tax=Melastoma candidum TaxID=119954 RepID=A0ACB9RYW7_9MYRT|nr:hypothetical protein MLD38_008528 [Melastoma candidum]